MVAMTNDHELAVWLAEQAGAELLKIRTQGLTGKDLKNAGDQASHDLLMRLLAEQRPADAVLSEEGADDAARLDAERVWILDPVGRKRALRGPTPGAGAHGGSV